MNKFQFQTEGFKWYEVEIKGKKKSYIEGYISTIDKDDYNDVVTMNAQKEMIQQIDQKTITMDIDHEEFVNSEGDITERPETGKIPVAKIIKSELKNKGVWVKAEMNCNAPKFKSVWNSVKDGFLHSFSIAFTPIKAITKTINEVETRFIESLNLLNVTLTGNPVNRNATFKPVMKAAIKSMRGKDKMTEQEKNEEQNKNNEEEIKENKEENKKETQEDNKEDNNESKDNKEEDSKEDKEDNKEHEEVLNMLDAQNKVIKKLEEKVDTINKENKETPENKENKETTDKSPLTTIKSKVVENDKVIKKLKAFLNKPVMKAQMSKDSLLAKKSKVQNQMNMFDMIK